MELINAYVKPYTCCWTGDLAPTFNTTGNQKIINCNTVPQAFYKKGFLFLNMPYKKPFFSVFFYYLKITIIFIYLTFSRSYPTHQVSARLPPERRSQERHLHQHLRDLSFWFLRRPGRPRLLRGLSGGRGMSRGRHNGYAGRQLDVPRRQFHQLVPVSSW